MIYKNAYVCVIYACVYLIYLCICKHKFIFISAVNNISYSRNFLLLVWLVTQNLKKFLTGILYNYVDS